jgi:BlaI family transcriptional regulator, penicillinase repressor
MAPRRPHTLSRRERQIMDVVYRLGAATAAEVVAHLPDPPSYSAVRTLLGILEDKGHLRHEARGTRYVYLPIVPRTQARRRALDDLLRTFFQGSPKEAVVTLIEEKGRSLSAQDLAEIRRLIEQAAKQGR